MGFPQISVEAHKLILSAFQNENGSNRLTREGQAKSRDCSVLRGRVTSSVTRFRVTSGPGRLGARRTGKVGHQAAAVGTQGRDRMPHVSESPGAGPGGLGQLPPRARNHSGTSAGDPSNRSLGTRGVRNAGRGRGHRAAGRNRLWARSGGLSAPAAPCEGRVHTRPPSGPALETGRRGTAGCPGHQANGHLHGRRPHVRTAPPAMGGGRVGPWTCSAPHGAGPASPWRP